jgi:two-component system nitrate/nitrite response regulator NarL
MKLLIADDHTLFRDALVQYVERADPAAQVTVAKDFREAYAALKENSDRDLVLLDLRMPHMNGMEGFRRIREEFPQVKLALMSGVAEEHEVKTAMNLGAAGYFPKTLSGKALLRAIQLVLNGERFIPLDSETNAIMPSYHADAEREKIIYQNNQPVTLTPRETQVLAFLARGVSNKEIARELELQVVTVKLHVRGICRKLDAKNRTQAAIRARELGIVTN